ncbi:hypothetical protein K466DRAFT_189658 [Polyporus arcularius HHB13444]|uniref:Uncharacterized protein n=1 Tax=Polyporus arcularius HHB13444 TaxID=1314778 RepID=A0A5C3P933_9APHY|nr:hypothetical protein K466DRAFT_189658 [Polyporus arcularius HHB13444]
MSRWGYIVRGRHPLPLLHGMSRGYGTPVYLGLRSFCVVATRSCHDITRIPACLSPRTRRGSYPSSQFPLSSQIQPPTRQLRLSPACAPTASSAFPPPHRAHPRKMLKASNRVAPASPSHVQPLFPTVFASASSAHIYKLNMGSFTAIIEHLSTHVLSALLYLYHMQSPHQLPQSKRPEEDAPRHNQKLYSISVKRRLPSP